MLVGVVEETAAGVEMHFAAEELTQVVIDFGNHLGLQLQQSTAGSEIHRVLSNVVKIVHKKTPLSKKFTEKLYFY